MIDHSEYQGRLNRALREAWEQLLVSEDPQLTFLLSNRAERICGVRPDRRLVAGFMKAQVDRAAFQEPLQPAVTLEQTALAHQATPTPATTIAVRTSSNSSSPRPKTTAWIGFGYALKGRYRSCKNGRDVLQSVFEDLAGIDPTFLHTFARRTERTLHTGGQRRRYLAGRRADLYPDNPGLASKSGHSVRLNVVGEWWLDVHQDMRMKARIIQMACEEAGLRYGVDLKVDLG